MADPIINTLGIVGIKNCGEYDSTKNYEKLNVVSYEGSSYCAKGNTVGNLPTNTTYWDLLAQKGDQGNTGIQGPQGPKPVKGVDYYTAEDIADLESTLSDDVEEEVSTQIGSLTSATPLVASSTSDMSDTTRIYVNTTDGKWYYYNGSAWTAGGTYQSTGLNNNSVHLNNFDSLLQSDFTELYQKVDISEVARVDGKFIFESNGTEGPYSYYSHTDYITCVAGERYISTGLGLAYNVALAAFYDNSNAFISSVAYTDDLKGRPFTVPTGATKMMLSYETGKDIDLLKLNKIKLNGQNELNYNDMDQIFKNTFIPKYEEIDNSLWVSGKYYNTNGVIQSGTAFKAVELPVIPGEKIIITGSSESYQVLYTYRLNGTLVKYPASGTSFVQHTNVEVTIPEGVYLLKISTNQGSTNSVKRANYYGIKGQDYAVEQLKKFNIENQLKNDFAWSSAIDNAKYVTFTFDDSLTDIDLVEDLFESKGVPCCFAAIPEKLENLTTNGETVKEVLDRCVAHGGEVLSHSSSFLTENSSDAKYMKVYVTNKQLLEEAGYEVNGIITAGGEGAMTQNFAKDTLIARNNYLYGDLTSYHDQTIEQYYNPRQDIYNLNWHKSQIDGYVAGTYQPNSRWLNYLMHGTSTFTIEALGTLIDYAISKGLTVATWKTVYDTFKSSKLEERIKQLEN